MGRKKKAPEAEKVTDFNALIEEYEKTGDKTAVKDAISEFNLTPSDFDANEWSIFLTKAFGVAVKKGDEEFKGVLKGQILSFADPNSFNNANDIAPYLNLISLYPDAVDKSDLDQIFKYIGGKADEFAKYNQKFVEYIGKRGGKGGESYAIDLFSHIKEQNEEMGKMYLDCLFNSPQVAENVLHFEFFKSSAGRGFTKDVRSYINGTVMAKSLPVSPVGKIMESVRLKRQNVNIGVAVGCLAVAVAVCGGGYAFLNSVNANTVKIDGEGIVNVVYGQQPDLSGYSLTYSKYSGQSFTVPVETDMLVNYDSEKIGNQQVDIVFMNSRKSVTVSVIPATLKTPTATLSGNYLCWDQVEHADGYAIYVTDSPTAVGDTGFVRVEECAFDFKTAEKYGSFYAYVVAYSNSEKYSDSAKSQSVGINKLQAVNSVNYSDGKIVWDEIEGADHYMVEYNGATYTNVKSNSLEAVLSAGANYVTVHAFPTDSGAVESVSEQKELYKFAPVSDITYKNDRIEWNAESQAEVFSVKVDGVTVSSSQRGKWLDVSDWTSGMHSVEITCVPQRNGEVVSETASRTFSVDESFEIQGSALSFNSSAPASEYTVIVDGAVADVLTVPSYGLSSLSAGRHEICVVVNGTAYSRTVEVEILAVPTLSVVNGILQSSAGNVEYYCNGFDFDGDLDKLVDAGEYAITAVNKAQEGTLQVSSAQSSVLKVTRLSAPRISLGSDETLVCNSVGTVEYYYNGVKFNGDFSDIPSDLNEFTVTARVIGSGNELTSAQSNGLQLTRAQAPTLTYDTVLRKVIAEGGSGNYRYFLLDGTEIAGGDLSGLGYGVFEVRAKSYGTGSNVLSSGYSNTVTVFYTDVKITCSKQDNNASLRIDLSSQMTEFTYDISIAFYVGSENIETVNILNQTVRLHTLSYNRDKGLATSVIVTVVIKSPTTTQTDEIKGEFNI